MKGYKFHSSLLGGYDVRGVYGEHLSEEDAYHLGLFVGCCAPKDKIVVIGCDYRDSSPLLVQHMKRGICEAGANCAVVGYVVTSALHYVLHAYENIGGYVMVTASHNPLSYNGFKIALDNEELQVNKLQDLYDEVAETYVPGKHGEEVFFDAWGVYQKLVGDRCRLIKNSPLCVWYGCGGVAEEFLPNIADLLGHVSAGDGAQALAPDPTLFEHRQTVKRALTQHHAEWAFAMDGDGDRCVVFYQGRIVPTDYIVMALVQNLCKTQKSFTVVWDSKFSHYLMRFLQDLGVSICTVPTGHVYVREAMYAEKALLGFELSCHYFMPQNNCILDDGILMGLNILDVLPNIKKLIADETLFSVTEEVRLHFKQDKALLFRRDVESMSCRAEFLNGGATRFFFAESALFMRASKTEDLWSLRLEAETRQSLKEACVWANSLLEKFGADVFFTP